jgi:hypothetical protein
MFEDIFSRRNLILKKMIDFFIEIENREIVLETIIKIKDIELIFKSLILFSKSSYIGIYSLEHRKKLLDSISQKKKEDFCKYFFRYNINFLRKFDLEKYLRLEILTLNYMYEKKYLNTFFEFNKDSYLESKEKIYNCFGENIKSKYFDYNNYINVKKGKDTLKLNIQDVIYQICKRKQIDRSMKSHVSKYYHKEYTIISEYLKYNRDMIL